MKKHLAIICGVVYPNASATGICARRFADMLSTDYDIDMICMASDSITAEIDNDNIKIHALSGGTLKRETQSAGAVKRLHHICGQVQIKARFLGNLQWFADAAFKKLIEIDKKRRIDAVFSVCSPLTAHVAAMNFKSKNGSVRWVAYTVDLYATPERIRPVGYSLPDMAEKEMNILDRADAVFLSEEIFGNHQEMVDRFRNVSRLPYVIPEREQRQDESSSIFEKDNINCVFAGSLYSSIRNPETMLEIFSRINDDRIILHLYSSGCDEIVKKYTSNCKNIIAHGRVSQDVIKKVYEDADVLINIGNANEDFVPSKTFEYIGTGKPIINFYYGSKPDNAMERYPIVVNISNGIGEGSGYAIKDFIRRSVAMRVSKQQIAILYPENNAGDIKRLLASKIG